MTARLLGWVVVALLGAATIAWFISPWPGESPEPGALLGIATFLAVIYAGSRD